MARLLVQTLSLSLDAFNFEQIPKQQRSYGFSQ